MFFIVCGCTLYFSYFGGIFGLTRWYKRILHSENTGCVWIPLALMLLCIPLVSIATVLSFAAAFGPGAWLQFIASPIAVFAPMFYIFTIRRSNRKAKSGLVRLRFLWHIVAIAIIIALSLAPIYGYRFITRFCYNANAQAAQPIIDALEAYQSDIDTYPDSLDALQPAYIEKVPTPPCRHPYYGMNYVFEQCADDSHVLWEPSVQGGFPQRYHVQSGEWSSISFFDGVCYYLDNYSPQ